jgi:hypothetical protein
METTDEQILLEKKARLLALAGLWAEHEDKEDVAGYMSKLQKNRTFEIEMAIND